MDDLDGIKSRVIQYLQSFTRERELCEKIVIPLFEVDYEVEDVHKKNEGAHYSDLFILPRTSAVNVPFDGVQVKQNTDIDNNRSLIQNIIAFGKQALDFPYSNSYLGIYYWITSGRITRIGRNLIEEAMRGENPKLKNRIKIWDVEDLVERIIERKPELITYIEIYNLFKAKEEHIRNNRNIFASHCSYLLFKKYFKEKEFSSARLCLKDAKSYLEKEGERSQYFYRTLGKYYEYWEIILGYDEAMLEPIIDSLKGEKYFFLKVTQKSEIIDLLKKKVGDNLSTLLIHMEFIFNQLDILATKFVNAPIIYSTLSILRLLMRMGYSPRQYKDIEEKIAGIKEEFGKEEMKSIHGKCTLCTGVAISCLSLAKQKKDVSKALGWIKQLKPQRYCFLEVSDTSVFPHQHAMHYTASVFQGVMDYGDEELITDVMEEFFKSNITDINGFYKDWMLYRKSSVFIVIYHIFSSFLKYFLSTQQEIKDIQRTHLFKAVLNLVEKLYIESVPEFSPFLMHVTRENLQSLCLGLILQGENIGFIPWVKELINIFGKKIDIFVHNNDHLSLMYSGVESTQRTVEGWLSYWETLLFLQERDRDIQPFLPDEQSALWQEC